MEDKRLLLAEVAIKSHFGPVVHSVCRVLLHDGPQSIEEIRQKTKMQIAKIKESLLVTIQHNFVHFTQRGKVTKYRILIDCVLGRLRFPRFLQIARENFKDTVRNHLKNFSIISQFFVRVNCSFVKSSLLEESQLKTYFFEFLKTDV